MKKSTLFGLWLIAISFIYELTITSELFSDTKIFLDIFPDFLGFLFVYLGIENLKYKNNIIKACGNTAIVLAIPSFITYAAQLSPYYLTSIASISNNGQIIGPFAPLAKFLTLVFKLYHDYENIFQSVYMIFLAVFCFALMTEISHRKQYTDLSDNFSHKDAYGQIQYSKKAYKIFTILSAIFTLVFTIQAIVLLINQWMRIDIAITNTIHTGIWVILLPINILFAIYANTAISMVSEMRREDLPTVAEAQDAG